MLLGLLQLLLVSCLVELGCVALLAVSNDIHRRIIVIVGEYSHWWLAMLFRLLSVLSKIHLRQLRHPRLTDDLLSSVNLCETLWRIEIKGGLGSSLDMRLSCRHAGNLAKVPREMSRSKVVRPTIVTNIQVTIKTKSQFEP